MATKKMPTFRKLDRRECDAILQRNEVGRIAYSFHDRVDIEPIHYVHRGEWLYARTSPGAKLMTLTHNRWVAFEVDEITGRFDWQSVVVRGSVYLLDPNGSPADQEAYEEGVGLLRNIVPETLAADDPVGFRYLLFRIHMDEVTGRAAESNG